jgi:hypothetical protein
VLQSVSGIGIDAARVARDAPVHQLGLCFERERFRLAAGSPWKVVQRRTPGSGAHLHNGQRCRRSPVLDVEVADGSQQYDHRRHTTLPSRGRRGFRTPCAILEATRPAGSSGCRDPTRVRPPQNRRSGGAGRHLLGWGPGAREALAPASV